MEFQHAQAVSIYLVSNATAYDLMFYTSFSANICVLFYFLLFYAAKQIVVCKNGLVGKIRLAHRHDRYRTFMQNFYFDSFVHTTLLCVTTVLILTSHAMSTPFQANCSYSLQILNAFITGAYIFLFFRELICASNSPNKWMNVIIFGVSVATLATVVITREDTVLVAILVFSNGDVLNVNVARLMKRVLALRGTPSYRIAIFMGTYSTVVFRALLPIGLIVLGLINGKPFNMSYPSVFFFFVGLLFFGALNTWQVNAALARICRKGGRVIEVQSREVHALPKPEDRQIQEGIELPPTYDEVCGEAGLATYVTESEDGSALRTNNEAEDTTKNETPSMTSMESDCAGAGIAIDISKLERQDSKMSDFTNEGFAKLENETGSNDKFDEIDLGLASSV